MNYYEFNFLTFLVFLLKFGELKVFVIIFHKITLIFVNLNNFISENKDHKTH